MENKSIIPFEKKLINEHKGIRIKIKFPELCSKRNYRISAFLQFWKFASLSVAFTAIFLIIILPVPRETQIESSGDPSHESDTTGEYADAFAPTPKEPLLMINESKEIIALDDYFDDEYSLSRLKTGTVLILHSHSSEFVSDSMSVTDAGAVIAEILKSAGIEVVHSLSEHDINGSIGAYSLMKDTIEEIRKSGHEISLVIDVHESDAGMPLTLSVGVSEQYYWVENLRVACALYNHIESVSGAVRMLPQSLGQDSGALTLNIGIGSKTTDEEIARKLISEISTALIKLYNEDEG